VSQQTPDRFVMPQRLGVEEIERPGRSLQGGAYRRVLRIEEPKRVLVELAAVVFAETGRAGPEVRLERLSEGLPGLGGAHGVYGHRQRAEAERLEEREEHRQDLDFRRRSRHAKELRADLAELPVAPGLRTLVAELRSLVPEAKRHGPRGDAVLDDRAHDPRGV